MYKKKVKILTLSSELTPLAKVGGLADVSGSLPKELKKLNVDIRVIIPYYQTIKEKKIKAKKIYDHLIVPFGKKQYTVNIYKSTLPNSSVPLYLFHHHKFLSQGAIYTGGVERFMFFSQAINEFLKLDIFQPDIIHVNDWHPASVIPLIKKDAVNKQQSYKTLLTIHNLAMKGKMPISKTKLFHPSLYRAGKKSKYNSLKQGIINADLLNTVSQQYAREILTKEYGAKLENVLKKNKRKLSGIVNGIDYQLFHPLKDKYLKKIIASKAWEVKK